jgi:diphthamide synthase (EF-2-diphthine--ammonia ligase)
VPQLEIGEFAPRADAHGAPDLTAYDRFVVFFSGGKDSIACLLHLLESGVPASRIECHHHLVDGEHADAALMVWPVTRAYCDAVASHLGTHFETSFRVGGLPA